MEREINKIPIIENGKAVTEKTIIRRPFQLRGYFRFFLVLAGILAGHPAKTSAQENPALPSEISFACRLEGDPDAPQDWILREINHNPVPGLEMSFDDGFLNEKTNEWTYKVSLIRGERSSPNYIQYKLKHTLPLGVTQQCEFERRYPPVRKGVKRSNQTQGQTSETLDPLRSRVMELVKASSLPQEEKEDWLDKIPSIMTDDQVQRLEAILIGEERTKSSAVDVNKLLDEIEAAIDREDYKKAAELFDRIFASGSVSAEEWIYKYASAVYGSASQPEKSFQYLLLEYSIKTGSTDKQIILEKIASDEKRVIVSVSTLMQAGKYEEAADLLTFYFQKNPALMNEKKDDPLNVLSESVRLAETLQFNHKARSAWHYYLDRKKEARWAQRWERILKIAIPAIAVGVAIKTDADEHRREEERKAAEERRLAEEAERRRQAARAAENERRARLGLPSLEEEEAREREIQERERERIRERCRRNCEITYHGCMSSSDPNCCHEPCWTKYCPTVCESELSRCQAKCE